MDKIAAHTVDGWCVLGTLLQFSDHTLNDHHAGYDQQGVIFILYFTDFESQVYLFFFNQKQAFCGGTIQAERL